MRLPFGLIVAQKALSQPPPTKQERALMRVLREAAKAATSATSRKAILDALQARNVAAALAAVRVDLGEQYLRAHLPPVLYAAATEGATGAANQMRNAGIRDAFGVPTPDAGRYIERQTGALITEWGRSSREALRAMVERAFMAGESPYNLEQMIRESGIGLNERQARAAMNLRERLLAQGKPVGQVNAQVAEYSRRSVEYRAFMIARTETAAASMAGRVEGWRRYWAEDVFPADQMVEWDAAHDQRVDDVCLDLDGVRVLLSDLLAGGPVFVPRGGGEGFNRPPDPHPNCRCNLNLVFPKR